MLSIKLPIPEKVSTNKVYEGMHWGKRKKLADLYHTTFLQFKNKFVVTSYPIEITFIYTFKSRPLDVDNVSFMTKMCIDGMRHIGLLQDDSIDFIQGLDTKIKRGDKDSIQIIIV